MISEQEELDWDVYRRYGLLVRRRGREVARRRFRGTAEPRRAGVRDRPRPQGRRRARPRPRGSPATAPPRSPSSPRTGPPTTAAVVEARIALIEKRRDLALIERPECKRRWSHRAVGEAAGTWRCGTGCSTGSKRAASGSPPTTTATTSPSCTPCGPLPTRSAATRTSCPSPRSGPSDALGRPDADLAEVVGALVDDEHVPFLAAYRYKPAGLAKRAEWEHTWALQRREDAVAARLGYDDVTHPEVRRAIKDEIGDVPVPPKYAPGDFARGSYWSQRGKLDVPKERFISYPAASRDGDGSLLLGWAGWDHREQAQALAVLVSQRRGEDGWPVERVTPLLAGLAEVLPWVRQWHGEIDARYGASPADIYAGFLDGQLAELQLTVGRGADLATHRTGRCRPAAGFRETPQRRTATRPRAPGVIGPGSGPRRCRAHRRRERSAVQRADPRRHRPRRRRRPRPRATPRGRRPPHHTGQRRGMRYLLP